VPAKHNASRPPSHGKDRHWHQNNSHKQGRRHQSGEAAGATGGIEAVAFLKRNAAPRRDREQRAARWTGQSKGS
jgi:hypothetical protein